MPENLHVKDGGLFEGDMRFLPGQARGSVPGRLWPNGVFMFEIESSLSKGYRNHFKNVSKGQVLRMVFQPLSLWNLTLTQPSSIHIFYHLANLRLMVISVKPPMLQLMDRLDQVNFTTPLVFTLRSLFLSLLSILNDLTEEWNKTYDKWQQRAKNLQSLSDRRMLY